MFRYTKEQADWLQAMERQTDRQSNSKYNSLFFWNQAYVDNTLDLNHSPERSSCITDCYPSMSPIFKLVYKTHRWPCQFPRMTLSFRQVAVEIKRNPSRYFNNTWKGYKAK